MVPRGSLWFFGRWPAPDRVPASFEVSDISSLLRSTVLIQTLSCQVTPTGSQRQRLQGRAVSSD
jgi:hypothetical protein